MGFWTALLAILSFFYDLPYMHAVLWISLDILILFFALALLPATLLLLVLATKSTRPPAVCYQKPPQSHHGVIHRRMM